MNQILWTGACVLIALACSAPARGQQTAFTVFPIPPGLNEGEDKYRELRQKKDRVVSGTQPFNENRAALDQWYTGYFFRSFTQPDQLDKLPLKRQELLSDLKRAGKDNLKPVHDYLLQRAGTYMAGFVKSEKRVFHPAVRFNAMLILGDLNAKENVTPQQRVPNPLASALPMILREYRNPQQVDAVRVAAMLGMLRHAKLDWNRPAPQRIATPLRTEMAQEMMALLQQTEPPGKRTDEGHVWMQRRAVDVLGALGLIGQVDQVNSTINGIVADNTRPIALRCTAAEALGLLVPDGQAKVDPARTSINLAALAADAGRRELDWIAEYQKQKLAKQAISGAAAGGGYGMMGGMGMGAMMGGEDMGMGMGMGGMEEMMDMMGGMYDEEDSGMGMGFGMMPGTSTRKALDPDVELAQRRLLFKLTCVRNGLNGLATASGEAAKDQINGVTATVDGLWKAALTPPEDEPNLDGLARNIRKAIRDLERITKDSRSRLNPEAPASDIPADIPSDTPPAGLPSDLPTGG